MSEIHIELTKGYWSLVDLEDYAWVNQWRWRVLIKKKYTPYAYRTTHSVGEGSRSIYMHRLINSTPDHLQTDHINHDGLDNRKSNLRSVTSQENLNNRRDSGPEPYDKMVKFRLPAELWANFRNLGGKSKDIRDFMRRFVEDPTNRSTK